jgi:NADH dehydrogenase
LDIRSDFLQDFEAALYMSMMNRSQRQAAQLRDRGRSGPSGVELAGALAEIRKTILKHEYREMPTAERMQIHLSGQ